MCAPDQSIIAGICIASAVLLPVIAWLMAESHKLLNRLSDAEAAEAHMRFRLSEAQAELHAFKSRSAA